MPACGHSSGRVLHEISLFSPGKYLVRHSSADAQRSGLRITTRREILASIFASGLPYADPGGYSLPLREPNVVHSHLQRFEPGHLLQTQCERVRDLLRPLLSLGVRQDCRFGLFGTAFIDFCCSQWSLKIAKSSADVSRASGACGTKSNVVAHDYNVKFADILLT